MKKLITVWDLPTRLFHWGIAIAVFYSWFSIEVLEDMQQHFYSGYVVLTLLLFRLAWGFCGSYHSRFSSFIYSPLEILNYAKALSAKGGKQYLGHNPLGSVSAVLMIILLLAQAIMGLYSSDDYYFGPLSGLVDVEAIARITEFHSLNSNVVFSVIGLHIAAIIYYQIRKNQALTSSMISGKKIASDTSQNTYVRQEKSFIKSLVALLILAVCMLVVYWLATAFLDRLPTPTESYY